MRILQVTSFFKPSWEAGGIARVSYEISRKLAENNEVTVYTTDGFKKRLNVKKNQPLEFENMNVYYFKNLSNRLASKNFCLPLMFPRVVKKNLNKFDIIHMHTFRSFLGICIRRYAKKYNIPYIVQTHGSTLPHFSKKRTKNIFDSIWGYKILSDASKVIALNKTEAEQYMRMGVSEEKIEIVPNGVDLSDYQNLLEVGEFRKRYFINDNEKVILFLGRIHKIKGIGLLVEAFGDLSKEMDNIKLVLVGPDDGYIDELKRFIQKLELGDKVLFTGPLYECNKIQAYVDADVYVLPSIYETFPVTVLEAWACGTPVIVTDGCGIKDYVENVGCVVQYNKNLLKNAIKRIIEDKKLIKEFSDGGKKLVKDEFDWKKIVEKLVTIYQKCV